MSVFALPRDRRAGLSGHGGITTSEAAESWVVEHGPLHVPASVRRGQDGALLLTVHAPTGAGYTQWGITYRSIEEARAGALGFVELLVKVGVLGESPTL